MFRNGLWIGLPRWALVGFCESPWSVERLSNGSNRIANGRMFIDLYRDIHIYCVINCLG